MCRAGSRPPELVTDESFPGCKAWVVPFRANDRRSKQSKHPNAVTTHTKTKLRHRIWRTFRG